MSGVLSTIALLDRRILSNTSEATRSRDEGAEISGLKDYYRLELR